MLLFCQFWQVFLTLSMYIADDSKQVLVSMDLWVDAIGAGASLAILIYAIIQFSTGTKDVDVEQISSSKRLKLVVLTSASIFLALSFSANVLDLRNYILEGNKNYLNWAHYTLLPGLLFAMFLNIGSVVNTIRSVSLIVREKTKIDRDLEIGKMLQSGILPQKKYSGDGWKWHAFYYPAAQLAGDWFDLRQVEFRCGKRVLVSVVADVTGHGISAAMMISNIASHWSLWCEALSEVDYPDNKEELDELISLAPFQIHRGLVGLRYNLGCSLAVVLFDNEKRHLNYLTAGHPGIVVGSGPKFEYLTTTGTRPGVRVDQLSAWEVGNKTLDESVDQIILYTDGIVEQQKTVPVWLKGIRREAIKSKKSVTSYFLSQLRKNRRLFFKR